MNHRLNGEELQAFYARKCYCIGCDESDGRECHIGNAVAELAGSSVEEARFPRRRQVAPATNRIVIPAGLL